jgi:hypothetical protein
MRQRLRSHLTYANVVATLCLFLVLSGGTAVALTGSNTVFSDDIVNGQVKNADIINGAITTGKLRNDSVTSARIVNGQVKNPDILNGAVTTNKLRDSSVGNADLGSNAVTGAKVLDNSLGGSDVDESSFGIVPNAAHATNSDELGGVAAANFQRRAVFPISEDLTGTFGGGMATTSFSPSQLRVSEFCGSNNVASVRFTNTGTGGGATLNWLFSQGGTSSTVNASGASLAPSGQGQNFLSFNFSNRLEGQWIFADGAGVTTVNLHGFIAPGSPAFCEFKGTAVWAPNV